MRCGRSEVSTPAQDLSLARSIAVDDLTGPQAAAANLRLVMGDWNEAMLQSAAANEISAYGLAEIGTHIHARWP